MSNYYLLEAWTAFQAIMVVALVLITIKSRLSSKKKKYPPVVGAWMVVRDLVLFKDKVPHRTFYQWAKLYGPVYFVRTGLKSDVVILNSAKAARQVIGRSVEPLVVEELGSEVLSWHDMYNLIVGDPGNAALEINWRDFLPFVNRWLPNKKLHEKLNNVIRRRTALVRALIHQERELLSSGKELKGYLDMLLKEGKILSERQLETAIWEPIIESTTTSHVAMERLYKEIEQVCGKKAVEEEDLGKLPYLKAIFYKTMRRHSPLPLVPLRIVHQDVEIDGYHVQEGWEILINIWGANNYEGEWKNSEEWKLERQLEFSIEEDIYRTMVFGAGNRLCVGWAQVVTMASLVIGRIVQNFELKMPKGHEDDYDTIMKTGTHKLHSLFSILTPRNA